MASTYPFKKATAVTIIFPILDADGDPVPDAAGLDSSYSLDGAQFVACTNEAVNILNPAPAITNTGLYSLTLVAGETNGDSVAIQVKTSTSGAKTTMMVFYTSAQTDNETKAVIDDIPTTAEFNARTLLASEYQRILASGTLTASSLTVPADTGRLEVDHYWDGCLLVPLTGADAYQPKMIRSFANTGGVFTLDKPFTTLPGLVTYIILAFQKDATVAQTGEATTALTAYDTGKGVAKDDTVAKELTLTTLAGIFPLDPASESAVESAITAASSQGEAATFSAQGEAATALADWVSSYAAPLLRILGLVQENQIIDTTVFDTDGHMTSARLRTFTDATLTIVLATYTTTVTYDVSGNMTNFQVVKV